MMTIEQAQQCRVLWEAKGAPPCRHAATENECYPAGEPTGFVVCFSCGAYIGESLENFSES